MRSLFVSVLGAVCLGIGIGIGYWVRPRGSAEAGEVAAQAEAVHEQRQALAEEEEPLPPPPAADEAEAPQAKVAQGFAMTGVKALEEGAVLTFVPALKEGTVTKGIHVEPAVENVRLVSAREYWGSRVVTTLVGDFKPGTTYTVTLAKDCPLNGESRKEAIAFDFTTKEAEPEVRFRTAGTYLPAHRAVLPWDAINVEEATFELSRAFENNLTPLGFSDWRSDAVMQSVAETKVKVEAPRNVRAGQMLEVGALAGGRPGVYRLQARWENPQDNDTYGAEAYFILTDLGVAWAKDGAGGFRVAVRSLKTGAPVAAASIEVAGRKNQTIYKGVTDAEGWATLTPTAAVAADPEPNKLIARTAADFVYLELGPSAHWQDRGKPLSATAPSAFVWPDRGAVRPGETVRLAGVVRDTALAPLAGTPLTVTLTDPRGTVVAKQTATTDAAGLLWADLAPAKEAIDGTYRAAVALGEQTLGEASFYVSDFVPDRVKLALAFDAQENVARLRAETYFGTPVPGATGQLKVLYRSAPPLPEWKEWTIGTGNLPLRELGQLDFSRKTPLPEEGCAVTYDLPKRRFDAPLQVCASAEIAPPGGRAVTAWVSEIQLTEPAYVGIRGEEDPEVTLLVPEGSETTSATAEMALEALHWTYAMKVDESGRCRYEWNEIATPVPLKTPTMTLADGKMSTPPLGELEGGRYRLTVRLKGGAATTHTFWHSAGEAGRRSANPSVLAFTTDRTAYAPGDEATLAFDLPGEGALLVVEGDVRLAEARTLPGVAGRNTVKVKVPASTRSGAWHVGITFVPKEGNASRCFGVASLSVSQRPSFGLDVALEAPKVARPGKQAQVTLRLTTPEGKPCAGQVLVAAVDEGILALTDYRTPDPFAYFFARKQSGGFAFGDLYGMLYPDLLIGPDGRIGGDAAHLNYKALRQDALARVVLPPIAVPASGEATVTLPLPPHFQGRLRIMAVASTAGEGRMGSADAALIVRPDITLQAAGVRYGCEGDQADLTFTLTNHDLPAGPYTLDLDGSPVASGTLAAKATTNIVCRLPVAGRRRATLRMGGSAVSTELTAPLRPVCPKARAVTFALQPEGAALPEGARRVGSCREAAQEPLAWLLNYPYDCTEQLSARALPFLGRKDAQARAIVGSVTRRLLTRWVPSRGGFSLWDGGDTVAEVPSLFAAHVALSAFRNGLYPVSASLRKGIRDALARTAGDLRPENRARAAYAVWALAQERDPAFLVPARNLLATRKDDAAAMFAAAALIQGGYAKEGAPVLRALLAGPAPEPPFEGYTDATATQAALLNLAAACGLAEAIPPEKVRALLLAPTRTPQANAFTAAALLALGKATPGATIVRREEMVEAVRPGQLIGVRRTFVNARGEPITALPHGELAYVRLDLTLPAATRDLALRDALPGGLEYEDPNLATRAQRPLPEWTEKLTRFTPTHTKNCGYEMRFFGDVPNAGTFTLVYPVRAVTRGVYRVPAVRVEAMYAPDLTGASADPATFTVE